MKKNLFISLLIVIFVLSAGVLTAAADPVRVAINPDTKPFKYYDEAGEFAGIDADVINGIAEVEGLEIEFVEMKFEDIAIILHLPETTVRSYVARARKMLKDKIIKKGI